MIKVWTDAAEAGLLDRFGARGSTFAYQTNAPPLRAVSVTMPLRVPSYNASFGLLPIFEMNLPEGVLGECLRLAFAKATGTFDDFDLLGIVGRSQVGRLRIPHGDPIHLWLGNSNLSVPTEIPAALAGLLNRSSQNSTPGCALMPFRKGCFTCFISVTRSASSKSSGGPPLPVITTCCIGGRTRSTGSTSSSRT